MCLGSVQRGRIPDLDTKIKKSSPRLFYSHTKTPSLKKVTNLYTQDMNLLKGRVGMDKLVCPC